MSTPQFKNDAVLLTPDQRTDWRGNFDPYRYHFRKAPTLMFNFGRLLQRVISQGGTYMLSGKFHDSECGIYKCEGGCMVNGSELVLGKDTAYWNYGGRTKKGEKVDNDRVKIINLISDLILQWDPMNPVDSMIQAATDIINEIGVKKVTFEEFKKKIMESKAGGVFGGNPLSDFFDWNPFSKPLTDMAYERWCRVQFNNEKPEDVDQDHNDRNLGYELLDKIIAKGREFYGNRYFSMALCCSPSRRGKDLKFWINTGRQTQIDGWKSLDEINAYLNSTGELIDSAKY
jgi:hypothetical protein